MIITLTGHNSYMLREELRRMVAAFLAEHTDMGLEKLDGEDTEYNRLREAIESLPFLASKKMVVLRTPGAQKKFAENIEELIGIVPGTTDLIIVESKLDKRLSYYKTLKKLTDFREFNELDESQLIDWLIGTARDQGGTITRHEASLLVRRLGVNQQLLSSELTKLLQYEPTITKETIELLTEPTPQSTTFDLLEAAMAGRIENALAIYDDQRKQKVEPLAIIGLLGWQLHILALLKSAGSREPAEIAKDAKVNPYVLRKSHPLAKRMTFQQLKDLVQEVHQLDIRLKSESIDADDAMKLLFVRLGEQ